MLPAGPAISGGEASAAAMPSADMRATVTTFFIPRRRSSTRARRWRRGPAPLAGCTNRPEGLGYLDPAATAIMFYRPILSSQTRTAEHEDGARLPKCPQSGFWRCRQPSSPIFVACAMTTFVVLSLWWQLALVADLLLAYEGMVFTFMESHVKIVLRM